MARKVSAISIKPGKDWFKSQGWKIFPFQKETWEAYLTGKSGLINAPTGSGKTYSILMPILLESLHKEKKQEPTSGLRAIWITPIKALAKEILLSSARAIEGLGMDWQVGVRTGDTTSAQRQKQIAKPPQILITTPESLHLLLASKHYKKIFADLETIIVDEWHELIGSKRGVQMELALSRLRGMKPTLRTWGISATIGNMDEALQVLKGYTQRDKDWIVVKADIEKKIKVHTVLPDTIEKFPWAGHMGITLLDKVVPIIEHSATTLIFTNTRNQCEVWYQRLLKEVPDLAGWMAMHHSSIDKAQRDWVEQALHSEKLKIVVCTSSLDLGVDFRPVETIIQIGSPKGVARFIQRAGRSGHKPGAVSKIYFVPTHSLELIEASALRTAIEEKDIESRIPYIRSFDVLAQYLVSLAIADGFDPSVIYKEIKGTFSYESISEEEWSWVLEFIKTGGDALRSYDDYSRVGLHGKKIIAMNKRVAMRHRMSIGTIVSDALMHVKYRKGGRIGTVEERFLMGLSPGDTFVFSGRVLELVKIRNMEAIVKKSKKKTGKIPAWVGGRISFSSEMSEQLRRKINLIGEAKFTDAELEMIRPLAELQEERSRLPRSDEFLIEYFKSREGFHICFYPFDGRYVHEGMSTLFAWRIAQKHRISFSIAMNDYGFELLTDKTIDVEELIEPSLFDSKQLYTHIQSSVNSVEMAMRRFRDIAVIGGLVHKGFPGKQKKDRHLQSSSQLFFQVFKDYEPDNLLLRQAYEEVMTFHIEEARLRQALDRISRQKIIISRPSKATPFAFPIMVSRMREKLSSESLEDRIKKMRLNLSK